MVGDCDQAQPRFAAVFDHGFYGRFRVFGKAGVDVEVNSKQAVPARKSRSSLIFRESQGILNRLFQGTSVVERIGVQVRGPVGVFEGGDF